MSEKHLNALAREFKCICEIQRLETINKEMLEALELAERLIPIARQYFPKSIKNNHKFQLENTCATIGKAITKARGGGAYE